jgi:hypothetical protein
LRLVTLITRGVPSLSKFWELGDLSHHEREALPPDLLTDSLAPRRYRNSSCFGFAHTVTKVHVTETEPEAHNEHLAQFCTHFGSRAMAPEKSTKPKAAKSTPKTVADFKVLALTLPSLSGLPEQCEDAKHYIYVKPHAPTVPTATDERSLFLANTPIDATESNLRALFADQLGGSMVERVEFDAPIPAQPMHKRWKTDKPEKGGEARGKKRKRNEEALVAEGVIEDEDSALPSIWPGELRRSGSGAVVIFVDKRSARGAYKELQKAVKESRPVHWKSGDAALGVERKSSSYLTPKSTETDTAKATATTTPSPSPPPPLSKPPSTPTSRNSTPSKPCVTSTARRRAPCPTKTAS